MKTLRILGLLLIAGVLFSCQKDIDKDVKQEVVFGINEMDPSLLKSSDVIECPDLEPTKAYIKLKVGMDILEFTPDVIFIEGKPYTKAIRLDPGTYEVLEFHLYTMVEGVKVIIMATPMAGSHFAVYVTKALQDEVAPFTFVVDTFEKLQVEIDVLCYEENNYLEFGFFWFQINRIVIREICFFGDFCMKEAADYANSLYADQDNFPGSGYYDAAAIFQIIAKKNGEPIPHWEFQNGVFTNANEDWLGEGKPLCVQYPDNIDIDDEEFSFELQILVKVGSAFEFVTFHTWEFIDNHENIIYEDDQLVSGIPTDAFGVADFVLGSCAYNPSPETLVLPPYMNLPKTANANFAHNANTTPWYWDINVNSVFPSGSYDIPSSGFLAGWCGDGTVTINPGTDKTFSVYSSLYPASWPVGIPTYITAEKLNKVNWLFNNLGSYGINISGTFIDPSDNLTVEQGKTIQNAIWRIINEGMGGVPYWTGTDVGNGTNMANDAVGHKSFVPLPGGWAAVLLVPHINGVPDATKAQLLFTVVDP